MLLGEYDFCFVYDVCLCVYGVFLVVYVEFGCGEELIGDFFEFVWF